MIRVRVDERIARGRYRMAGYLGPWSSSFTLAWLASHRGRLRTLIVGGRRLSALLIWDSEGSRTVDRSDADVAAIRVLVGPRPSPVRSEPLPDTWPNGVPYIDDETRVKNLNDPLKLRDLICHLELHAAYRETGRVRKMTTEQKELYADVIDNEPRDFEAAPYDRWWQR